MSHSPRKIVIAPDKFKGSLSAVEVAEAIALALRSAEPSSEMLLRPMADGGDGSMEVMETALGAAGITCRKLVTDVRSLLGGSIDVSYLLIGEDASTAFIEMAKVCGLSLIPAEQRDPVGFSTFGLGQLMRFVAEHHPLKKMTIAIGGSATNDGGRGMIDAFLSSSGETVGGFAELSIEVACDVTNPLLGPYGATYVYAPQKFDPSVSPEYMTGQLAFMEQRMADWARGAESDYPGAGAAGGVGFALHTVLGADLVQGWKLFSDMLHLEEDIASADLVITGEGRFDEQSLSGKLPSGIARMCREHHKPLWVICGQTSFREPYDHPALLNAGITRIIPLTSICPDTASCIAHAARLLSTLPL